jgi:hypothetical protein
VDTRTPDNTSPANTFAKAASREEIGAVAAALEGDNIEAVVVDTADEARERVLAMIPEGAEVHWAKSKTLEDLGLFSILNDSGRYDALRPRYMKMDRATQGREIRKLTAALVTVSYSASQIGPYAGGAGRVILVVGSQKIVPDLDAGIRRAREYVQPYEDARLREQLGVGTRLAKLLVTFLEAQRGRTTVVLVREPVGV